VKEQKKDLDKSFYWYQKAAQFNMGHLSKKKQKMGDKCV